MSLGEKLRNLRIEKGLTQKDLADQLHVSFQTISKWENDENEPDFATLKELIKIYGCSYDYLFKDDNKEVKEEAVDKAKENLSKTIGECADCGKPLFDSDKTHNVVRRTPDKENQTVCICDECFKSEQEKMQKRIKEIEDSTKNINLTYTIKESRIKKAFKRTNKNTIIWSAVISAIVLIAILITCIVNVKYVGVPCCIFLPILAAYVGFSTAYCMISDSFVLDVFLDISGWSIKMPGVIFTFDSDGIKFLIFMKIFLWFLGIVLAVGVVVLGLAVAMILSIFAFIPVLIQNKDSI